MNGNKPIKNKQQQKEKVYLSQRTKKKGHIGRQTGKHTRGGRRKTHTERMPRGSGRDKGRCGNGGMNAELDMDNIGM